MRRRAVVSTNTDSNHNRRNKRDANAPPSYTVNQYQPTGNSPPPDYEDSLLDSLYYECMPPRSKTKDKVVLGLVFFSSAIISQIVALISNCPFLKSFKHDLSVILSTISSHFGTLIDLIVVLLTSFK